MRLNPAWEISSNEILESFGARTGLLESAKEAAAYDKPGYLRCLASSPRFGTGRQAILERLQS